MIETKAVVIPDPGGSGGLSPSPMFRGAQMVRALADYRELQKALDESMPDQIMELDGRSFRKKGYWRAIAVAFNLTVEPIEEHREANGVFEDGRENFGFIATYRAMSPGGRSVTGDGSCFAVEKAKRFKCPHPEAPGSKRTVHFPHDTCPDFSPNFQWRVLPAQATEHNVRSHAHTRAFNRAVSNLVGFGEVSAEEVERDDGPSERPVERRADGSALVTAIDTKTGKNQQGKAWTMYVVTFDDGRSGSTFDEKLKTAAEQAKADGLLVIPTLEQKGRYWNLTGMATGGNGNGHETEGDPVITQGKGSQAAKFWAVAREHGWTEDDVKKLLTQYGYAGTNEIRVSQYEAMKQDLKRGPAELVHGDDPSK